MFAFSKDALDVIGQGTVKKSKMTSETTDTVAPQSSFEDAEKLFTEVADVVKAPYNAGASAADDVTPGEKDDVYIVSSVLCIPLAIKYGAKDNARVLVVESSEERARTAVKALEANKDISVATGLPYSFVGPKKVTVTTATILATLLGKRKNLRPFTHIIIANVTSFTIGVQTLLGHLKRVVNFAGAKGHHRVIFGGDTHIAHDLLKPYFNKLHVSAMTEADAKLVTIDSVAAYSRKQLIKIPATSAKSPFAPYTAFAADMANEVLRWVKDTVKVGSGVVAIFGQEGLTIANSVVPIVTKEAASTAKGLVAVIASSADSIDDLTPVAVIDLGVSTIRGANTASEALLQFPKIEFSCAVEIAQRRVLAGNHPYFALYPPVSRPIRSFDCALSCADRHELLEAARADVDLLSFVAPVRESAINEALTAFAELGLIQSVAEPTLTFLGEIVSRLPGVSVEMGTFVALAAALGLPEVATAVAASSSVAGLYKDETQKTALRGKYDPDDSNPSDLLADGVVLLTESEHVNLDAAKVKSALELQSRLMRGLSDYLPPSTEKHSVAAQRAALHKSASLLAYLLSATLASTAVRIKDGNGELIHIRSVERVKAPTTGSAVSFPTSGAVATAQTLEKINETDIKYEGITLVCTRDYNASQIVLRPVVQHSSVSDTNSEGDKIVRFAVASNGLTTNYHVPLETANGIIEARLAISNCLGLMMLRRLLSSAATTEDFVAAIRRKRRDFNFVQHIEETPRLLEDTIRGSEVKEVITTFVKKQTSILVPNEVGTLHEGAKAAAATDLKSLEALFEKKVSTEETKAESEAPAQTESAVSASEAAKSAEPAVEDDDEDEDFFSKHGPIMDDDDE
eukprot:GILI01004513.1.p1 GENE.GILI01004513.1~~GILI01004513.1.p1  ORF type:complete len:859 (-),score=260.15 GILI01004513.1:237-2813(-)